MIEKIPGKGLGKDPIAVNVPFVATVCGQPVETVTEVIGSPLRPAGQQTYVFCGDLESRLGTFNGVHHANYSEMRLLRGGL